MLTRVLGSLRAIIAAILYSILTFGLLAIILLVGLIKWAIYFPAGQRVCTHLMRWLGDYWSKGSTLILKLISRVQWDIQGPTTLDPQQSYFVIANHQTWTDIVMLEEALVHKTPLSRYFIKKQLLHVPIAGWGMRALDFPSMERYSKETLKKHPELRGKDIENTRRSCEKFKEIPIKLINFVESTRFTPEKHQRSASPYQHLLIPRAGGLAFAMNVMAPYVKRLLDMTIIYDHPNPTIWRFFSGEIPRVTIRIEEVPLTPDLIGDYQNDMEFRKHFQKWLNDRWAKKDKLISENTAPSSQP